MRCDVCVKSVLCGDAPVRERTIRHGAMCTIGDSTHTKSRRSRASQLHAPNARRIYLLCGTARLREPAPSTLPMYACCADSSSSPLAADISLLRGSAADGGRGGDAAARAAAWPDGGRVGAAWPRMKAAC